MTNRDNDRIIQVLSALQEVARASVAELANAGAAGHTLSRVANALESIEGAVCYFDDPNVGMIGGQLVTTTSLSPVMDAEGIQAIVKQVLSQIDSEIRRVPPVTPEPPIKTEF